MYFYMNPKDISIPFRLIVGIAITSLFSLKENGELSIKPKRNFKTLISAKLINLFTPNPFLIMDPRENVEIE